MAKEKKRKARSSRRSSSAKKRPKATRKASKKSTKKSARKSAKKSAARKPRKAPAVEERSDAPGTRPARPPEPVQEQVGGERAPHTVSPEQPPPAGHGSYMPPREYRHGVPDVAEIPTGYGEDDLNVQARDARWLFCYWELGGSGTERVIAERGRGFLESCRWVLHVSPSNALAYHVDISPEACNWYLQASPRTRYRVEIGLLSPGGEFVGLAEGREVETPPEGFSETFGGERGWLKEEFELIPLRGPSGSLYWQRYMSGSHGLMEAVALSRRLQAGLKTADPDGDDPPGDGDLLFVLHAHLPYVRHPEYERFLEEDWLFEAVTETYCPLIELFGRLADERVRARAGLVLSPPLCEMLADPLLRSRYEAHLGRLIEAADVECEARRGTPYQSAAEMYCSRLRMVADVYRRWSGDLLAAFRSLDDRGAIELVACAATHGFLPLVGREEAVRAQVELGCRNFEKHFGRRPAGFWLPECAYRAGLDVVLSQSGIRYFFLDSHGVLFGSPRPEELSFRPVLTPAGPVAFPRDPDTGIQVWSAECGYPGDPIYREFYRDLGYDGDGEHVNRCLHPDGVKRNIGLKYHRVTGRVPLDRKEPYVPAWAHECVDAHAEHFASVNEDRARHLSGVLGRRPVICAMYDAELFGHWWFEGIDFLEGVLRRLSRPGSALKPVTPSAVLEREREHQVVVPAPSSWGYKGYYEQWLNGTNDWIYPHLHVAERRMSELVHRFPGAGGVLLRAIKQAGRELLLAQASDWAFLMTTGTAYEYAVRRTHSHVSRFTKLYEEIVGNRIDEGALADMERRDAIFQEIDPRVFVMPAHEIATGVAARRREEALASAQYLM
ncbi:MAG: 1,4-alpha-glucan branching protein domain-containing protein [Planctomycetota bacterium]|jgi:1,4-alpha-glucan branching enzyme